MCQNREKKAILIPQNGHTLETDLIALQGVRPWAQPPETFCTYLDFAVRQLCWFQTGWCSPRQRALQLFWSSFSILSLNLFLHLQNDKSKSSSKGKYERTNLLASVQGNEDSSKDSEPYARLVSRPCPLLLLFLFPEVWPTCIPFPSATSHSSTWFLLSLLLSRSPRILRRTARGHSISHPPSGSRTNSLSCFQRN